MKRTIVGVAVVLSLAGGVFAKETRASLRIFGGTSMARYSDLPFFGGPWLVQNMNNRFGAAAGIGIDLALGSSGRLAWISNLEYLQMGAKPNLLYLDLSYEPQYLTFPVPFTMDQLSFTQLLKFRPFAKGVPYVLGGFDLSYIIDHRSSLMSQLESLTRKVNFGLVGGVGGELLKGDWTPFLEARYHFGLVDLSKGVILGIGGFPSLKTRALVVLAGVRLKWGRSGA
jgi:hypothetical protein